MSGTPSTFALETYARRSFNYLTRMVDRDSLPYFNVFWTEPAEAAHDWPDFGDVMSRQLQAAVMGRVMTGERLAVEKVWYDKVLSLIDRKQGLLFRPQTSYCGYCADMGDQALTLYALVTVYGLDGGDMLGLTIRRMVDTLLHRYQADDPDARGLDIGFAIKSLMACVRVMGYEPAAALAGLLTRKIFTTTRHFSPDNMFRHGGHMHMNLRALLGAADWALYAGEPVIYSRTNALYQYVRSEATRFGFLPEVIGRTGDVVLCETCALMDFLGLATTLANHGHPEYWGDVERVVRNHLVESQATDTSWLRSDPTGEDTPQFTWRDVGGRMIGGYAGWTSPNHFLAARETLHWGGPELRDKPRAFQNCCGGSGTHAFFIAWKNAARFTDGQLSVNLHVDKLLPQAEIRCFQPYQGLLSARLTEACVVRVRIPEFVRPEEVRAMCDGEPVDASVWGNYLEVGERRAGQTVTVSYPLAVREEEFTVGNPGFRQYRYRATWKGDTVVRMTPLGNDCATGYSDYERAEVPVYYGTEGPAPLYRRDDMLAEAEPVLSPIHRDDGLLDFWCFGQHP